MSDGSAAPRPAATVVVARGESPWEVLFLKRHHKSGFMANAYVFPGGRLDGADGADGVLSRIQGVDLEGLCTSMDGIDSTSEAAAYVIAAVRETFEEAGVLLARDATGALISFEDEQDAARYGAWRERLNKGEVSFQAFLEAEDLHIDGGGLRYFDHWVTPTAEPKRFDARFFVVAAPAGQRGVHDGHETTASVWRTPADAIEAHETGSFMLPPPTWRVLKDLIRWNTRAQMLEGVSGGAGVIRTEPRMMMVDGVFTLALPGDPEHDASQARRFGKPRIVLDEGHWAER